MKCPYCKSNKYTEKTENGKTVYICSYCLEEFTENTSVEQTSSHTEKDRTLSQEEIADYYWKCVAEIKTKDSIATAFLISKAGILFTNEHVVHSILKNEKKDVEVILCDEKINGEVIATCKHDCLDLAIIAIDHVPDKANIAMLGNSDNIKNAEKIFYIGNSKGEGKCITGGIISDSKRIMNDCTFIMTDAPTNAGNSGCPLIDEKGNVIGIHCSAKVNSQGMKYAIPINHAKEFADYIADNLNLEKGALYDITPTQQEGLFTIITAASLIYSFSQNARMWIKGAALIGKILRFLSSRAKKIQDFVDL